MFTYSYSELLADGANLAAILGGFYGLYMFVRRRRRTARMVGTFFDALATLRIGFRRKAPVKNREGSTSTAPSENKRIAVEAP